MDVLDCDIPLIAGEYQAYLTPFTALVPPVGIEPTTYRLKAGYSSA